MSLAMIREDVLEVLAAPAAIGQIQNVIEDTKDWNAVFEEKDSFVRVLFRRKKLGERSGV